jgi:hypothetical protein
LQSQPFDPHTSHLIPRLGSCAPILPPRPELIATPEVSIQPPSSARRAACSHSPRLRRLAPCPPPPDAPRRPLSSATPPPPPVLVGLGAYSLHHVGGGSGGGRGTKQLSRLGCSSLTKTPPNLINEEDGDGVHAPPLRPFSSSCGPTTPWHRNHRFSCGASAGKHTWLQAPPASTLLRPASTRPCLPLCSRGGSRRFLPPYRQGAPLQAAADRL